MFQNENTFLHFQQEGIEDEYHALYERAVKAVRGQLGETHPLRIGGEAVETGETFTVANPANTDEVVGRFASGSADDVDRAVEAAKAAFDAWRKTPYQERAALFERAADITTERKFELAATMTVENGKNRHEALADVDEAIDFLRYYAAEIRRNRGYVDDTGRPYPGEYTETVLRPYGVFAVIAPFNFPFAILVGMTTGALITGNTAVVKPASATPLIAHRFFDVLRDAGLPDGVANLVTGGGRAVGQPLLEHPDVEGVVFTGSRKVGMNAARTFMEKGGGPVIAELGGKNAVLVTENADMDKAVQGTWKGAFGFSGQKCSAASRAYVHESIYDEFVERLADAAKQVKVGAPERKDTFMGPIIDADKVAEYEEAVEKARADGTVLAGGNAVTDGDLAKGHFVEPTVITDLPEGHELEMEELFLPIIAVWPYSDWDEAMARINAVDYGLTGGIITEDPQEAERYFDEAQVGVAYWNRAKSATTGALVQGQPFGGWKMSGLTGKAAGGAYYLPQFMRQQSRTRVRE